MALARYGTARTCRPPPFSQLAVLQYLRIYGLEVYNCSNNTLNSTGDSWQLVSYTPCLEYKILVMTLSSALCWYTYPVHWRYWYWYTHPFHSNVLVHSPSPLLCTGPNPVFCNVLIQTLSTAMYWYTHPVQWRDLYTSCPLHCTGTHILSTALFLYTL